MKKKRNGLNTRQNKLMVAILSTFNTFDFLLKKNILRSFSQVSVWLCVNFINIFSILPRIDRVNIYIILYYLFTVTYYI
jgi:hypothetical protein